MLLRLVPQADILLQEDPGLCSLLEASTSLLWPTSLGGMVPSHHRCAVLGLHFGFAR